MNVVADENIPFVEQAFRSFGPVRSLAGASISRQELSDADLLLVRSVTRVDRSLLEGTPVRFVGSATIGTDHVDLEYLAERGIAFGHAPGSNAESVVEYVLAALLCLAAERHIDLESLTLGVVGCGNIGGRLVQRLAALGCPVVSNDPPLQREAEEAGRSHSFIPLDDLVEISDVVSLHVPLTHSGRDPTWHLFDRRRLSGMQRDSWLLNTSRGAVVDNRALLSALKRQRPATAVLDVWEAEPTPDAALIEATAIATPHIAGYSFDGKVAGTAMILEAACAAFGREPEWSVESVLTDGPEERLEYPAPDASQGITRWLHELTRQAYPIREDDRRFRGYLDVGSEDRAACFIGLRKGYPRRRSFRRFRVSGAGLSENRRRLVEYGLGFHLA